MIEVKTLICHEMECGQRKDASGKADAAQDHQADSWPTFNGKALFRSRVASGDLGEPATSRSSTRPPRAAEFTFTWKDDDGSNYVSKNKITVG
ncbi:MAG: thiosulfate oxidation carrier complex protein SoxZ [Rhodopseudomonas palustris]|nr:thiosulfate oxidation carrier complex protein SoxZ [Rhodopseudomonas palustris]